MKKITLLAFLIIISIFGLTKIIFADASYLDKLSSTLSVNPASYNATAGTNFKVTVQVDPNVNKVCAIAGNLSLASQSFGDPYLKSIVVAKGIVAQPLPSQVDPRFYLVIPGCTTAKKDVLELYIGGEKGGKGSVSLDGIIMYGPDGRVIISRSKGGEYNIAAKPVAPKNNFTAAVTSQLNKVTIYDMFGIAIIICAIIAGYFVIMFFKKYSKNKK